MREMLSSIQKGIHGFWAATGNELAQWERRLLRINVGVDYAENIPEARDAIQTALGECESVLATPKVEIYTQTLGGSSVDFEVAWWTAPAPGEFRQSLDEVISAIKKALDEANIEIPFPQQTLSFRQPVHIHLSGEEPESSNNKQQQENQS